MFYDRILNSTIRCLKFLPPNLKRWNVYKYCGGFQQKRMFSSSNNNNDDDDDDDDDENSDDKKPGIIF